MGDTKARWKRAPLDHRRVAPTRTAPQSRFTRGRRSGALPAPLRAHGNPSDTPLLKIIGVMALLGSLSILLVLGIGTVIRTQQQYDDIQQRAAYYGRPTQPFSTLAPETEQTAIPRTASSPVTPLPSYVGAVLSASSSDAALTEPDGVSGSSKSTLASYCDKFGIPVSIDIFDWNDWSTIELSNALVAQLPVSWDASGDLWQGYDSPKPFNQPDDARDRWRLQLFSADGTERWIQIEQSPSTPRLLYVYAFQVITPYADNNGNHYGYHPCRAFSIASTEMDVLLSSARAYQSSGSRFPAFATPDDARWVSGTATPLDGSFALRSIPTLQNNNPLQDIDRAVPCYFITDVSWGAWAQVKLGNTTAWVDTSTVRLEAS